jgi:hypothetical protein
MEQARFDRAFEGWQEGYLIEEAMYMYPDPDSINPCVMRPAEAREFFGRAGCDVQRGTTAREDLAARRRGPLDE